MVGLGPEFTVTVSSGDNRSLFGGGSATVAVTERVTFHITPVLGYIHIVGIGKGAPFGKAFLVSLFPRLAI
jgi:hypothetical protein